MDIPLRILHLEDSPQDAELVSWELKKGGFPFEIFLVDTKDEYSSALGSFKPDIIISDHSLPAFNSREALQIANRTGLHIPFLLVTATVSEEFAVEILAQGAWDYILKDRLQRLPAAVINAHDRYLAESAQKRSEDLLKRSRANLKTLLDNTEIGHILISSDLIVTSFNEAAVKMSKNQFNKPLIEGSFALDYFDEDRKQHVASSIIRAMHGERIQYEVSYPQPVGTFKWFDLLYTGVRDSDDKSLGAILSITDINERKKAALERDRIATDLIVRNKALEQFTYIVSHNLRAPVANILGLAYLFNNTEITGAESSDMHKALEEATRNLDNIVKDLNYILQTTQHKTEQATDLEFSNITENVKESIAHIIEKEAAVIEYDFSEINSMYGVHSHLYSIFYNLVVNSIKFRRSNVRPIVRLKSSKTGNQALLKFSDNGQGIDLSKHDQNIFSLYSNFNPAAGNKGVGLFMVKTMVDMLNGSISAKSKLGEGTEFLVSFPLTVQQKRPSN